MKNNSHIYFAIDSDILRAMTNLDLQLKNNPNFDSRNAYDFMLKNYGGYIKTLLNLAKADKARLLIVNTVYQESKHSPALCSFIKEYCFFPNINAVNTIERTNEVERLAMLYCSEYTFRGETYPAPMKTIYNAFLQKHVPSNDVYAMAEATYDNAFFITNNGKDFIFDKKNHDINKDRTIGIITINNQNGYYQKVADNWSVTPKPLAIQTLGPLLKDIDAFVAAMADDNTKIKADRIL